jgi:hypothetical protein
MIRIRQNNDKDGNWNIARGKVYRVRSTGNPRRISQDNCQHACTFSFQMILPWNYLPKRQPRCDGKGWNNCEKWCWSPVTKDKCQRRLHTTIIVEFTKSLNATSFHQCYSDKSNLVNTFKQVKYSKNCCSVAWVFFIIALWRDFWFWKRRDKLGWHQECIRMIRTWNQGRFGARWRLTSR